MDWRNKNFFGFNNNITKNINYQIDMPDYNVLRVMLTDADSNRFSIPANVVPQYQGSENMRLEMLGVSLADPKDPKQTFGFKMVDVLNASNWFVTTIG